MSKPALIETQINLPIQTLSSITAPLITHQSVETPLITEAPLSTETLMTSEAHLPTGTPIAIGAGKPTTKLPGKPTTKPPGKPATKSPPGKPTTKTQKNPLATVPSPPNEKNKIIDQKTPINLSTNIKKNHTIFNSIDKDAVDTYKSVKQSVSESVDEYIDFKSTPISCLISSSLFILYAFLDLMDMNDRVLTYNILTSSSTTRATIVFAYLNCYYIMILKIIINLLTVFILLCIVGIVLVSLLNIFKINGKVPQDTTKTIEIMKTLSTYTLGFIIADDNMPKWIFIFLILIPILIVFTIFGTSRFYNQDSINSNTKTSSQIMQTFHDTNMFLVVVLVAAGILYMLFTYKW